MHPRRDDLGQPFAFGTDYLKLPRDPQPWLIHDMIPTQGLVNCYARPKIGKALALDTPIFTPTGWRTIGAIETGDYVFGSSGQPIRVLATSPVEHNRICYKITFTGGHEIVADAEHLWTVHTNGEQSITKTTQELIDCGLYTMSGKYQKYRWKVNLATNPMEFPSTEENFPIDPYTLGVWLGDGTRTAGSITSADRYIVQQIRKAGWTVRRIPSSLYGYGILQFKRVLNNMGLLDNKHIPDIYMFGSVEARKQLLAGLLDTDGWANRGVAEFCNKNERLARQVQTLALSLGCKVGIRSKESKLYGKPCGIVYTVGIRATFNPFRLPRKRKNFNLNKETYWTIKAITPVPSVPVKCLVVDSPDRLFIIGNHCVVTHNSYLALGLSEAIANPTVQSFLGFPVLHHGKVLYFQIDTPRSFWADRLEKIVATGEYDISNIGFADRLMAPKGFNILNIESKIWLKEEVAKAEPLLVVLDTLRELHSGDENDSTTMKNVVSAVIDAIPSSAIMFISHSRKEFQNIGTDIMDDARGSGYIAGRMDAVIKMTSREMHIKSRGGAQDIQIGQNKVCGMIERVFTDASLVDFADYLMHVHRELSQREVAELMAKEAKISEEVARFKIRQWEEKREKQFERKDDD